MNHPAQTLDHSDTPWRHNGIVTGSDKKSPHWSMVDELGLKIGNARFKAICETAAASEMFEIKKPFRYPTHAEIQEMTKDIPKFPDVATMILDNARKVASDIEGKNIPAADLTNEQKGAIFLLAGFMKYEDGKMVSIRPVGITDDGRGGYIVGIAPELQPKH